MPNKENCNSRFLVPDGRYTLRSRYLQRQVAIIRDFVVVIIILIIFTRK